MAKSRKTSEDVDVTDTVVEEGAAVETSSNGSSADKQTGSIIFTVPLELKSKIEAQAKAEDKPVGAYVRLKIAELFGYELPATQRGRARKYATPEERMAAQKKAQSERNALVKQLLAEYRAKNQSASDSSGGNAE